MSDAVLILIAVAWVWFVWLVSREKTPQFSLRYLFALMTMAALTLGTIGYLLQTYIPSAR
jgi:hypothetical protein